MTIFDGMPTSPTDVVEIAPEEFAFAMQVGDAAGAYRMPMESPSRLGVSIEMSPGDIQRIQLTDHPMNRFGMAVREHFGDDKRKMASFLMRWFALMKVMALPECQRYIRDEEGTSACLVHSAVFDAAAQMPLNEEWHFDTPAFFAKVGELYALDPD